MADFKLYFVALVPTKPSSVKSDFKNICISKIHILSTTFFLSLPWFKPVLPAIDNKINLTLNSIVNKTMHELYFHQVVIFWIKYNEAPAELFIIYLKCWI